MTGIVDFDGCFQFDDWQVFPDHNSLQNNQNTIAIEPKMLAVLVFLAKHQGEIVGRDRLMDNVWKDRLVSDEILTRIVSLPRSALKDSSRNPRYIKTIPKKGYLFLPKVSEIATASELVTTGLKGTPTAPQQFKSKITALAVLSTCS